MVAGAIAKRKHCKGLGELIKDAKKESARRLHKQSLALVKLAQPQTLNAKDFKAVIQDIIEVAAQALDVDRVSVWLTHHDESALDNLNVYEFFTSYPCQGNGGAGEYSLSPPIPASLHPPIYAVHSHPRPSRPPNAPTNGKTQGIQADVSSRWDTPIWLNEQPLGVVSYEQIPPKTRSWTHQDQDFSKAIANLIALKLEMHHKDQAMQALAQQESVTRLVLAHSKDLISKQTPAGIYLYVSPACQALLGYDPQEWVGCSVYEFLHPQDVPTLKTAYANLLNGCDVPPIPFRFRHQEGDYLWFESSINRIPAVEMGTDAEIVVVSRPMIKHPLAEKPLPKPNLETLSLNSLTTAKPVSAKFLEPSGIAPRLPRLTHTSTLPTRSRISTLAAVVEDRLIGAMTLLGNQPVTAESRRTFGWVANAIAVAIDQYWARSEFLSRRESLLFGLATQIRKSLELHTILETAVQSIRSLLKIDRCQFFWYRPDAPNPYWEVVQEARNPQLPSRIGQYETNQIAPLVERLLKGQILQVDEVETCRDPILRQFLTGWGYTSLLAIPIQTRAGAIGAISCSHGTEVRPWDNSEVELLQAVVAQLAIALDQAELYAEARKTAEVAQAQAQELEQALHQLKATQAQLVQSEKMSSLGQLVAGVAHELNNPVNFIHNNLTYASAYIYDLLAFVHIYQDYYPNPVPPVAEQAELIDIDFISNDLPKLLRSMQRGTDRISSIVNSLRNFSRLDEAEMKSVDLNHGLDSTLLLLQHRLKPKGVQPEIQVLKDYGNLPKVECYPGQLNQVFMNLISNAIEAVERLSLDGTQHPSPTITIRTKLINRSECPQDSFCYLTEHSTELSTHLEKPLTGLSQSVVIQIADNGVGMTDAVKARLFDPFFSTKPVGQGTGLGLSISYQIVVEHHHGVLDFTSVPGKGTEFWIEIPIHQIRNASSV